MEEHNKWCSTRVCLGPLLFNLFINDLFYFIKDSDICNYADDNTLSFADCNVDKIIHNLENEIKILVDWFKSNGFVLNGDKCQFLLRDVKVYEY